MEQQKLRSLYSPERGMIACVLLQAAYGGEREPCHFFGPGDWETGHPDQTYGWIDLTREEWRFLGMLSREERIAAWEANRDSGSDPKGENPERSGGVEGEASQSGAEGNRPNSIGEPQ